MKTIRKGKSLTLVTPGVPDVSGIYICKVCGHTVELNRKDYKKTKHGCNDVGMWRYLPCPKCKNDILILGFWEYFRGLTSTGYSPFVDTYKRKDGIIVREYGEVVRENEDVIKLAEKERAKKMSRAT